MDNIIVTWIIVGIVFIISELIIPGAIVMFLGIAALLIALCLHFSFIAGWVHSITYWFISSLVLVIAFRGVAERIVGGDYKINETDEDIDAVGQLVEVTEDISVDEPGRIKFRGTTWRAITNSAETIKKGTKVKIAFRDNINWVVESLNELEEL